MSKKHTPWSYVVLNDDKVVGAFPSVQLAWFVWKAYVDYNDRTFDPDSRPFVSCNRFRAMYEPKFEVRAEDLTIRFMKYWEIQNDKKL